jgi:cell division protein FtsA
MNEHIFSLDIGTRKIGIFATNHRDDYTEVLVNKIVEHKSRAVRSGQIHDIEKVSALITEIKDSIEKESGLKITKVATAIAGRNLRCMKTTGESSYTVSREITQNECREAELLAIQEAVTRSQSEVDDYLFVGHTVVSWRIDSELISNPLGHYANSLQAEIITTFLPKKVLESLFAVAKKCGLEISYLTLEPIAAAESVIPAEMRHIPIVLVDIGAGTSDIALVSKGSIQSFGMIPVAGDFITEYICGELLVDFNEAERIKRETRIEASNNGQEQQSAVNKIVKYKDIFGREYEKNIEELINIILPAVKELAAKIAEEVRTMAAGPDANPKNFAVVLVGGGSLTVRLNTELAMSLGIHENRVGLRSPAMVNRFVLNLQALKDINVIRSGNYDVASVFGPQTAVLLGVSCLASKMPQAALIHVTVNDKRLELINFCEGGLTVMSALVSTGISRQKISGKMGLAKTVLVNGELKVIKGSMPRAAEITVNAQPANISDGLKEGDRICFTPAVDGRDASARVFEIIPAQAEYIFNGQTYNFPINVKVDGVDASADDEIKDNSNIEISSDGRLISILAAAGIERENLSERIMSFDVLGKKVEKSVKNCVLSLNGQEITKFEDIDNILLKPADNVEFQLIKPVLKAGELVTVPEKGRDLKVKINEEEFTFPGSCGKIVLNGREVDEETEVSDGDIIRTMQGRDAEAVLVDVFRYIALEPRDTAGKRLKLFVNQQEANFTTPLSHDSDVRISFE